MRSLALIGSLLVLVRSLLVLVCCVPEQAASQTADIDFSPVAGVYRVFQSMQSGDSENLISRELDSLLATRAYRTMFRHYNRSWRPNHLPPAVFKRMILSLQFPEEYSLGENQRADQMLPMWRRFYSNLSLYDANLHELEVANLRGLIAGAVRDANGWLPPEWRVPDFYLPIIPSGGSAAFSIDTAQGYDFFQLPRDSAGMIRLSELRTTIAHEAHHLGVKPLEPQAPTLADSVAWEFLSIFMPEGTAVKFINNFPGGCVPAVDNTQHDPTYTPSIAEWWTRYTAEEPLLFQRLVATYEQARSGKLTRDSLQAQIGSYWLAGYVSPVYFIGAELFGAIYHAYGKDGAFIAMRDAREVLPMYHDALKARPALLHNCYRLPDSTAAHARGFQRASNR